MRCAGGRAPSKWVKGGAQRKTWSYSGQDKEERVGCGEEGCGGVRQCRDEARQTQRQEPIQDKGAF